MIKRTYGDPPKYAILMSNSESRKKTNYFKKLNRNSDKTIELIKSVTGKVKKPLD